MGSRRCLQCLHQESRSLPGDSHHCHWHPNELIKKNQGKRGASSQGMVTGRCSLQEMFALVPGDCGRAAASLGGAGEMLALGRTLKHLVAAGWGPLHNIPPSSCQRLACPFQWPGWCRGCERCSGYCSSRTTPVPATPPPPPRPQNSPLQANRKHQGNPISATLVCSCQRYNDRKCK